MPPSVRQKKQKRNSPNRKRQPKRNTASLPTSESYCSEEKMMITTKTLPPRTRAFSLTKFSVILLFSAGMKHGARP